MEPGLFARLHLAEAHAAHADAGEARAAARRLLGLSAQHMPRDNRRGGRAHHTGGEHLPPRQPDPGAFDRRWLPVSLVVPSHRILLCFTLPFRRVLGADMVPISLGSRVGGRKTRRIFSKRAPPASP